jgi:aryl-alcohol dehydrogenase-like predicted oxidoreductase
VRKTKLAVGTVQLGMDYGINNSARQPNFSESKRIIETAIQMGINVFDCARAYGDAESRLGSAIASSKKDQLTIVTKLDPLPQLDTFKYSATKKDHRYIAELVQKSVHQSLHNLQQPCIQVLMLHRWNHRHNWDETVWQELLNLRQQGLVQHLGASISTPEEAEQALHDPDIAYMQIPFNVLDWRWKKLQLDELTRSRQDLVIHTRSSLLQGLLTMDAQHWPLIPGLASIDLCKKLAELTARFQRTNIADFCLAFVQAQPWIKNVVVGMENINQLEENIEAFQRPSLTEEECKTVEDELHPLAPKQLLNPADWPN